MFKSLYKLALAGLALGLLAGCGGGSGGSQLNQPTSALNVDLSIQGLTDSTLSTTPSNIDAKVTDGTGAPVVGAVVTFSVDDSSSVTMTQTKAMTGTNGVASVPVSANAVGTATVIKITASAATVSNLTAANSLNLNVKPGSSTNTGTETSYYLQYVSAAPTRLVIDGASSGSGSLSETSIVTFKVLDQTGALVKDRCVYFRSSTYNGAPKPVSLSVATDASTKCTATKPAGAVVTQSNSAGVASVTVKSGSLPESLKISAFTPKTNNTNKIDGTVTDPNGGDVSLPTKDDDWVYANDQIAISSSIPDQSHFSLAWQPGAACATGKASYPCAVLVTVGDFMGHPAPDGTLVVFATSQQGLVIGTTDSGGKATGYCTTKAGQCTANVYGDIIVSGYTDQVTGSKMINNELVAFAIGDSKTLKDTMPALITVGQQNDSMGPWDCKYPDTLTTPGTRATPTSLAIPPTTSPSTAVCVNTFTIDSLGAPTISTPKPKEIITEADGVQYVRARLRW